MRPVTTLPAGYVSRGSLDLARNIPLLVGLSVASIVLFFVFSLLFFYAAATMIPNLFPTDGRLVLGVAEALSLFGIALMVMVLVVVLHELTHGAFFWLFTRERPVFGFRGLCAYAADPKWYLPRLQYISVGLAPLVILTFIGLLLLVLLPHNAALIVIFALALNAGGAVGDLYVVFRLLLTPSAFFVQDVGDGMVWYGPEMAGN